VVPQVQITLHNVDENTDVPPSVTATGNFLFENLKPGHYRLTGAKEGFAIAVVDKVELAARQDIRLDLKFAVAATSQQIEVTAAAVAVNTENATLSDSKINTDITQLPINSRSVSSSPLAALAVSPSVTTDSQGNIAVGGATSSQTGFSVDGISTANVRFNGALQDAYPSMENIAEMKVTAFNNNAEFAQIGDVTFVTKSGTNQLHGSAFEYFQNSGLDANVLNFTTKAPRTFNTFGGSLGGPVTIPKLYHGKDKTFFFLDYEGNRKTQSYPEQLLVPTAAERNGNLNDLVLVLGTARCSIPSPARLSEQHHPDRLVPGLYQSRGSGSAELLSSAQRQPGCPEPLLQLSDPGAEPHRTPTASISDSITILMPSSSSMRFSARTPFTRSSITPASLPPQV
jgi:hypothetical protein